MDKQTEPVAVPADYDGALASGSLNMRRTARRQPSSQVRVPEACFELTAGYRNRRIVSKRKEAVSTIENRLTRLRGLTLGW